MNYSKVILLIVLLLGKCNIFSAEQEVIQSDGLKAIKDAREKYEFAIDRYIKRDITQIQTELLVAARCLLGPSLDQLHSIASDQIATYIECCQEEDSCKDVISMNEGLISNIEQMRKGVAEFVNSHSLVSFNKSEQLRNCLNTTREVVARYISELENNIGYKIGQADALSVMVQSTHRLCADVIRVSWEPVRRKFFDRVEQIPLKENECQTGRKRAAFLKGIIRLRLQELLFLRNLPLN